MIGFLENVWDWMDTEGSEVLAIRHSSKPLVISCQGKISHYTIGESGNEETLNIYLDKGYVDNLIEMKCYGPYWSLTNVSNMIIECKIDSPVEFVKLNSKPLDMQHTLDVGKRVLFRTNPIRIDGFSFEVNVKSKPFNKDYLFETQDLHAISYSGTDMALSFGGAKGTMINWQGGYFRLILEGIVKDVIRKGQPGRSVFFENTAKDLLVHFLNGRESLDDRHKYENISYSTSSASFATTKFDDFGIVYKLAEFDSFMELYVFCDFKGNVIIKDGIQSLFTCSLDISTVGAKPRIYLIQGTQKNCERHILLTLGDDGWILKEQNDVWTANKSELKTYAGVSECYFVVRGKFYQFKDKNGKRYYFNQDVKDFQLSSSTASRLFDGYQIVDYKQEKIFYLEFIDLFHFGRIAGLWNRLTMSVNKIIPLFLIISSFKPFRKLTFYRFTENKIDCTLDFVFEGADLKRSSKSDYGYFFPAYTTSFKGLSHGNISKLVCRK